jgi:hypothetical protein
VVLRFDLKYVETIPKRLEENTLYVSFKYQLAIHLCACGCGLETVTPFDDKLGWKIELKKNEATLTPSILNSECSSHYYIINNNISWL